jgi:hypothetical protein
MSWKFAFHANGEKAYEKRRIEYLRRGFYVNRELHIITIAPNRLPPTRATNMMPRGTNMPVDNSA